MMSALFDDNFTDRMKLRVDTLLYVSVLLLGAPGQAEIIITKRRLCVEYVVENSRYSKTVLAVFENVTESECLRRCARHQECNA